MSQLWLKWFGSDWLSDPAVRMSSYEARGLWMDMLCLMMTAEPCGSLIVGGKQLTAKKLAMLTGGSPVQVESILAELEENGVFSRDPDGTIFSRRMRRDATKAAVDKANGSAGGNPNIRRGVVPKEDRIRPYKRSDSPAKTRRIFDRSAGSCNWCSIALLWDWNKVGEMPANLFHVDHVIAICDGGTNDEDNLVASCARCNHDRARVQDAGGVMGGNGSGVSGGGNGGLASEGANGAGGVRVGVNPVSNPQSPESRVQKESSSKDARAGAEEDDDDDEVLIRKVEGALAGKASPLVVRKGLPIVRGWIAEGCDLALHVLPELSEIGRNLKTPLRTLDSAKWAAQVRARRDAELHEPPSARPPPTNVLVRVDSPESKAWLAYLHKKSFPLNRAGTGFYQPSRWPPGYEPPSAAEALH